MSSSNDRKIIEARIFSLQDKVSRALLHNPDVDKLLDSTTLLDEWEEIIPDPEYGIFVIAVLNNIRKIMQNWKIFKQGVIEELPLQIGVFPFGVIYGIMAIESGLTPIQAFLMSSIIFGGASQIAFVQLVSNGIPTGAILTTVSAINSRHFLLYFLYDNDFIDFDL